MRQRHPNSRRAQRLRAADGPGTTPRRKKDRGFVSQLALCCLAVAIISWGAAPRINAAWAQATSTPDQNAARERRAYYSNCDAARAADAAPIFRGQPGYRPALDADSDGIACEPYR